MRLRKLRKTLAAMVSVCLISGYFAQIPISAFAAEAEEVVEDVKQQGADDIAGDAEVKESDDITDDAAKTDQDILTKDDVTDLDETKTEEDLSGSDKEDTEVENKKEDVKEEETKDIDSEEVTDDVPEEDTTEEEKSVDGESAEDAAQEEETEVPEEEIMLLSEDAEAYTSRAVSGNFANVIVFVDFNDTKHEDHKTNWSKPCFAGDTDIEEIYKLFNGSDAYPRGMRQFLQNISYGQLEVANIFPQYDASTNSIKPYKLQYDTSHYTDDNDTALLEEVLQMLEADRGLADNVDRNNDGAVDNLTIIVPYKSGLTNTKFYGRKATYQGSKTIRGKAVASYNVLTESGICSSVQAPGVIIHEFLHTLGYPDLYRKTSAANPNAGHPVGRWDIMANTSTYVQYPLAYFRSQYTKWFDIPTVTNSVSGYTLYAASSATEATKNKQAVILKTDYSDTEFFVLEYRKAGNSQTLTDYDCKIPGSGLIIYKIDLSKFTNYEGPSIAYIYREGDYYNDTYREAGAGDLNKSFLSAQSGRTSYGSSDMSKSLSDGAITYTDGRNSGIVISNVGNAGGDTISFDITFPKAEEGMQWSVVAEQNTAADTYYMDSYMDTDGTMYFMQAGSSGAVSLYSYNSAGWKKVSSDLNVSYGGRNFQLGKYGGYFYVGYVLNNYAKLARWNHSKWETVYTSSATVTDFDMDSASDGIYLAYTGLDNCKVYAYKYSSSGAGMLGASVGEGNYLSNISVVAESGNVAIRYREFPSDEIYIKLYDGSKRIWNRLGGNGLKATSGMIQVHNGKVYLLNNEEISGQNVSQMYLYDASTSGSNWMKVGNGVHTNEYISEMDICFHGDAIHTVSQGGTSGDIFVKNLKNGAWEAVGNRVTGGNPVIGLRGHSYNGKIYVAYFSKEAGKIIIKSNVSNNTSEIPGGTPVDPSVKPPVDPPVINPSEELPNSAEAYVKRLYKVLLEREADSGGLSSNAAALTSGRSTASDVALGLIQSTEFANKRYSAETYVTKLFQALFFRDASSGEIAEWTEKLKTGVSKRYVLVQLTKSAEFTQICNSCQIKKGNIQITENRDKNYAITAYVNRCYQNILGRSADESGLNTWTGKILSGHGGAEIIKDLVLSTEFKNKRKSDSEFLDIIYKAMLGRTPDDAGKKSWMACLDKGVSYVYIINGFAGSKEFGNLCKEYGMVAGRATITEARDRNIGVTGFVMRNYKTILGRNADVKGLNDWCEWILSKTLTPAEAARGFVFSQEFVNKHMSDAEYVETLYKAFLDRKSDSHGKQDWVNQLRNGRSREDIFWGFANSEEFRGIVAGYGL